MPMLFRVDEGSNIFMDYPELLQDGRFSNLSDKEMKWVVFYADFSSPYRRMPDEERQLRAAQAAKIMKDGSYEKGLKSMLSPQNKGRIMGAVYAYGEMQGKGALREQINAVDAQLRKIMKILKDKTPSLEDATYMKNWADAMNKYTQLRKTLVDEMEGYNQEREREKLMREQEAEAAKRLEMEDDDSSSILEELHEDDEL